MDRPTRRILLVLTGGLFGPFAVFVAVLFLSGGTATSSVEPVADLGRPRPAAISVAAEPGQPRAAITVGTSGYGQILFDGRGRALYAFTRDPRGRSLCVNACAQTWPPYLLRGSLRASAGTKASLLDTIRRPNGARQVTYAGRPLYYWVGDHEPGDVGCQNVFEFGGLWLVLRRNGRLVR